MMRNGLMIVAGLAALLTCARPASTQAVPEAPQPQKKAAPKTPPDPPAPAPSKDENAFPETVSRQAAEAAQKTEDKSSPSETPTSDANPFPEAVSRSAAKAAGQESGNPAKPDLPPGVSSSQAQESVEDVPAIDPVRAKKDTEVGSYYLKTYDYQGALLRFHDATAADPTNVDAIFGLAEAHRGLGKKSEAAREYQLYLDIVPDGPKAKEARKALKSLSAAS